MDNASKALIMAGAILISLALVGLGVYIFSMSSNLQDNTAQNMDALAAQTQNAQLEAYAGRKIKGSQVRDFVNLVATLNSQQVFPINIVQSTAITTGFAPGATTNITVTNNRITTASFRDSGYYQIVLEDRLPAAARDGFYDSYNIRGY